MLNIVPELLEHLERHHGVVATSTLRSIGYSATAIKKLVRHGVLELLLPGVYRQLGRQLTPEGRWAAVCLAHPRVAIAGPTAAAIWGFRRVPPEPRVAAAGVLVTPVHVIAPPAANPTVQRWVATYRTAAIDWERDIVQLDDGIRLTGRPRTALDLARTVHGIDLVSIIQQAMHDGPHDADEMRAVAVDWRSPRRRWVEDYLRSIDRSLVGAPAESHLEVVLGDALRAAGLHRLERQFVADLDGYGRARFDLADPEARWAIEVDGHPSHHDVAGRRHDEDRDRAAHRAGWTVTRVGPEAFGDALPASVERLVALGRRLRPAVR